MLAAERSVLYSAGLPLVTSSSGSEVGHRGCVIQSIQSWSPRLRYPVDPKLVLVIVFRESEVGDSGSEVGFDDSIQWVPNLTVGCKKDVGI
ncbi:hypothetical protein TNIN_310011 [Trichonephila inaurata madagascariensis]|uniref:Uncharacterized protein n=1 Tax=Trichonephila inaurata madagascariensis TaxID=2747483 RepID=A0A8X7BU76_9ARAC|nr:hypothetical protein TNIN_310011 [Trichonephila inaurata madagascariensis]